MSSAKSTTRQFLEFFIRAYPSRTALMVGLMVAAGFAETVGVMALIPILEVADISGRPPSTMGQIFIDLMTRFGVTPSLGPLLCGVVIAITLKSGLLFQASRTAGFTTAQVSEDLRLRLMRSYLFARWSYFGEKPLGRFSASVNREVNRTAQAYQEAVQLAASVFQIFAYLVASALLAWNVTLFTLLIGAGFTLAFRRLFAASKAAGIATTKHNLALSGRLVDVLQGMKPLKAMARESLVWPFLEGETKALNQAQRKQVTASSVRQLVYEPTVTAILAVGLFLVLGVGDRQLSEVLVLAFVFYRIMQHINTLQSRYQSLLTGEGAFISLMDELAQAEGAVEIRTPGSTPVRLQEMLEARNVWFSYGLHEVLQGVSLEVPAGAFVAISGASGSGKTTLADLFIGLHTPAAGQIVVDGIPLGNLDLTAWRHSIGYVPQEMLVFNDTVFRNVTLGDERLTRDDVKEALRFAGAWEFVQATPGGLDHPIGERGSSLSGGQRQRIAIARALVWKPSLLILDEVTTALDPVTEAQICETLRGLRGRTTIIAISHQPAIRESADIAYTLSHGQLARV